jgi:hypothetical protein
MPPKSHNKKLNSVASLPGTAFFAVTRQNSGPLTWRYVQEGLL